MGKCEGAFGLFGHWAMLMRVWIGFPCDFLGRGQEGGCGGGGVFEMGGEDAMGFLRIERTMGFLFFALTYYITQNHLKNNRKIPSCTNRPAQVLLRIQLAAPERHRRVPG